MSTWPPSAWGQQGPAAPGPIGGGKLPGPSLIIAYSPCINHGINMSQSQREEAGSRYRLLAPARYNPLLAAEGKNPLSWIPRSQPNLQKFFMNEVRFRSLKAQFPERADKLLMQAEQDGKGDSPL